MSEYKDKIVALFKDMDVEVRDWRFVVEKVETEYNIEAGIKLTIKPKD